MAEVSDRFSEDGCQFLLVFHHQEMGIDNNGQWWYGAEGIYWSTS